MQTSLRASLPRADVPSDGRAGTHGERDGRFISVEDVSLTYVGANGTRVTALQSASLELAENAFLSIVGPSGCGKTTLLRILGDLLKPSAGRVAINGKSPEDLRVAGEIGFMFQDAVLLPWKTIRANIGFLRRLAGRPALSKDEVTALGRLMGIEEFLDRYPHELSGGMRQRAAVARSFALDPTLLLMDEPFGALDEITRHRMNLELLRVWSERRKTVVFVTHSISEAAFLSDRVIVMSPRPGRIVADVTIDLPRPRTEEHRYGDKMHEYEVMLHKYLLEGASAEERAGGGS